MKLKILTKRIILYFILVLVAFITQTSIFPILTFFMTAPNLMLIVVFSYGYIYGSATGILCGIFAGLLTDIFYGQLFGVYILIFSYIGFFSGYFHAELSNDSLLIPSLLCLINEIFFNFAMLMEKFFSNGYVDVSGAMKEIILPEIFFTLISTVFIYRILLLFTRKLDTLDDIRGKNVA